MYTKIKHIPYGRTILQIFHKNTKHFHFQGPPTPQKNTHKLLFLVRKNTIWQPWLNPRSNAAITVFTTTVLNRLLKTYPRKRK
jgi:hypothetical protein